MKVNSEVRFDTVAVIKSPKKQFEEFAKKNYGGHREPQGTATLYLWKAVQYIKQKIEGLKEHNGVKPPKAIHLYLLNDGSPNALATKFGDEYFIGINFGAMMLIIDFYLFAMRSPDCFTSIGEPCKEDAPTETFSFFEDMNELAYAKHEPTFPNCDERSAFGLFLAARSLQFLLAHELNHIYCGHVGFWKSKLGSQLPITECFLQALSNEENKIRKILEWDADQIAINGCIIVNVAYRESRAGLEGLPDVSNSKYDEVFWSVYSAIVMIFLLGEFERRTKLKSEAYPTCAERSANIALVASKVVEMNQYTPNQFPAQDAFSQAAKDYITFSNSTPFDIEDLIGSSEPKKMAKQWGELANELAPHAYQSVDRR